MAARHFLLLESDCPFRVIDSSTALALKADSLVVSSKGPFTLRGEGIQKADCLKRWQKAEQAHFPVTTVIIMLLSELTPSSTVPLLRFQDVTLHPTSRSSEIVVQIDLSGENPRRLPDLFRNNCFVPLQELVRQLLLRQVLQPF